MKKIIALTSFIFLIAFAASAQHAIRAERAGFHVGESAVVVDSIFVVKVYNDSTLTLEMGDKAGHSMSVVMNFNSKLNPALVQSLNKSLIEVTGNLVLVAGQPTMVISDPAKLYFISGSNPQNTAMLAQLAYKR